MIQTACIDHPMRGEYKHLRKADSYYRAEIKLSPCDLPYQFKLRDLNEAAACFIVNKDSSFLDTFKIGTEVQMKCWTNARMQTIKYFKAKISNITKQEEKPFKGHCMVGLTLMETQDLKLVKPSEELLRKKMEINNYNYSPAVDG
jgi:hypothetical protein